MWDQCKGTATILVKGEEIKEGYNCNFIKFLSNNGFKAWGKKGNYGCEWAFVNLNTKIYALGIPGVQITEPLGNHAISIEEFITIHNIYKKYKNLLPLDMKINN